MIAVATDITERKRAEEELAEQKAVMEAVLANMDQGVIMYDPEFKVQVYNEQARRLWDFPEDVLYQGASFDLGHERAVVVGVGNVAVDVARVLCRTPDELAKTDITDYALEALRESRIREVLLMGRRGPAQAAFTNTELKELGRLADADALTLPEEVELDPLSRHYLDEHPSKTTDQKVEILQSYSQIQPSKQKRLVRATPNQLSEHARTRAPASAPPVRACPPRGACGCGSN